MGENSHVRIADEEWRHFINTAYIQKAPISLNVSYNVREFLQVLEVTFAQNVDTYFAYVPFLLQLLNQG